MRPKNEVPSYLRHKATGQARVVVDGKTYYLGQYGSAESKAEYSRLVAEWSTSRATIRPAASSTSSPQAGLLVSELIVAYDRHAAQYYVKRGVQTSQVAIVKMAMRPVKRLYGHVMAKDFGPVALEVCRQALIEQGAQAELEINGESKPKRKLTRSTINKLVSVIRLMFRWGAARQLVPATVAHALECLDGLHKGRSEAKDSKPVRPVRDEFVEKSIPFMPRQVAAMVQIQSLTGMRPSEVVIMRACDLNTSGRIWEYRPATHKTEHHEDAREKIIYVGPKAQAVLRPWFKPDLEAYLFSPAEALAERSAERRENRKTPLYPSHQARYARDKARRGRRSDRDRYDVTSYRQAIRRACEQAGVPIYKPNQIRHALATKIRREFAKNGLETAGAVLGHADTKTTEIYAEKDAELARHAMEKIG